MRMGKTKLLRIGIVFVMVLVVCSVVYSNGLPVMYTIDGGQTWRMTTVDRVEEAVVYRDDASVVYRQSKTQVLKSSDEGKNWQFAMVEGRAMSPEYMKQNLQEVESTRLPRGTDEVYRAGDRTYAISSSTGQVWDIREGQTLMGIGTVGTPDGVRGLANVQTLYRTPVREVEILIESGDLTLASNALSQIRDTTERQRLEGEIQKGKEAAAEEESAAQTQARLREIDSELRTLYREEEAAVHADDKGAAEEIGKKIKKLEEEQEGLLTGKAEPEEAKPVEGAFADTSRKDERSPAREFEDTSAAKDWEGERPVTGTDIKAKFPKEFHKKEQITGYNPKTKVYTTRDGKEWKRSSGGKTMTTLDGKERYSFTETGGEIHYIEGKPSTYQLPGETPTNLQSSFAKTASINKKGQLVINKKVIDNKKFSLDSKEGIITNLEDKSRIIALDKGTAEIDKDSKNIVIRMEGQDPQRLTAQQYKALTGTELKADTTTKTIRTDSANLGFIIEALGIERISLDQVERRLGDGGRVDYFAGKNTKVTIVPPVPGKPGEIVVTRSAQGFYEKGDAMPDGAGIGYPEGNDYEVITKRIIDGRAYVRQIETNRDKDGKIETETTSWDLNNKGEVQSMTLEVDGVEKKFNEVEREKLGDEVWQFYRYESGENNLYYNYEYGGWYAKNEKGEYRKAIKEDFDAAGVSEAEADKLAENMRERSDSKDKEDGNPTKSARDIQRFFGALESAASGGLGRFFSLFMEDEKLAEWREGVDNFLCSTIIGGGTSCWTSKICSVWAENKPGGGIMYAETPSGMLDIAVHIEAHKDPITYPIESGGIKKEYLYKVTYVVKNPSKDPLAFNVILSGERTTALYSGNIVVEPGGQSSRLGASAVVQYSNYDYNTVCIKFDRTIKVARTSLDKVCNKIVGRGEKVLEAKFRKKEAITTEYTKQTEAEIAELNI